MNVTTALKKATAALIAVLTVFSFFAIATSAETEKRYELNIDYTYSAPAVMTASESGTDEDALVAYLTEQMKNCAEQIDIEKFGVGYDVAGVTLLTNIISGSLPECFHISEIGIGVNNNNIIVAVYPSYIYTKSEYDEMYADCMERADQLLSGIKGNADLGDVEKALLLHDRLALLCEYDEENYENNTVPAISHTMYGALVNRIAVCQGYALAYGYLLDQVGIDNYYCSSAALGHAWNIVYIDGVAYHVDVTWDDPVYDISGRVNHNNFLRSTAGMVETNHKATDFDATPTDTTYDDYFWQESNTAFVLADGDIYYLDNEHDSINRYDNKEKIYTIKSKWTAGDNKYWNGDFARLASDGKNLLFSTSDAVYKFSLKTNKAEKIYTPDFKKNKYFSIYGFMLSDGYLVCDVFSAPDFNLDTKKTYEIKVKYEYKEEDAEPDEEPEEDVGDQPAETVPGDINGDEGVNLSDVVVLAQYVANWDVDCNTDALDVTGDGRTDLNDVVHLAQYVANWEGIILH